MAPSPLQSQMRVPDILGHQHKYDICRVCDIDPHYEKIRQWIPADEETAFKDRMFQAIEENNAWRTQNTFLYYTKDNRRIATGVALFGQQNGLEIIALFIAAFWKHDRDTYKLRFKAHPGKMLDEYKALVTKVSLQRAGQNPNHPLTINVNELRDKFHAILTEQIPK